MRLFSYLDQNKQKRVGLLRATDSKEFIDVAATDPSLPASLCDIIATEGAMARVGQLLTQPSAVIRDLAGVTYIPLVDNPGKIICLGLNYADHAAEGGHSRPDYPAFFMRGPSSLVGHLAPMIRPRVSMAGLQ